ncbi:MAG: N-acetyltransferase [Phenylobacterium sp.]|uniref:GNAT family N-acetyltransferase n=1 Tax=Phenylobacterium sp. TaxID=1871053 RepID=UPI0025ED7F91|nr:GNAT family N-acetyltransferase [Phenylobacterium sp.]MBA4013153.1 N-acetyltransferase [Phenylobacterium sp.]
MTDPLPDVVRTDKRFEFRVGDDVAFAEYRLKDDSVIFPHTVVPEAFAGQGVGKRLVEAGLQFAREQKLWVRPHCPFFHAYISKRPELYEMVHPDERPGLKAKA